MVSEKVNKIASIVLGIDIDKIDNSLSPTKNDEWDSLHHMMLISEIEKEFNVTFSVDEAVSIKDLKSIKDLLRKKIQNVE